MPWELEKILPHEIAREGMKELQLFQRLEDLAARTRGSDFSRVSAMELAWYMRNQLLRDADWAGMAHSLEIRVPFVDVELYRRVWTMRVAGIKPDKGMMAETPQNALPPAVRNKAKTGFGIPVREWLMQSEDGAKLNDHGLRGWAQLVHAKKWGQW